MEKKFGVKIIVWKIFVSLLVVIAIVGQIYLANDGDFYIKNKNSDWQKCYNLIPNSNKDIYIERSKDINFVLETGFDDFENESFNASIDTYKYFGIDGNSLNKNKDYNGILKNIDYLFYNSDKDFAVKILSKDKKDEIIFYLTNSDISFDSLYKEVLIKTEKFNFSYRPKQLELLKTNYKNTLKNNVNVSTQTFLKIPFIKINETIAQMPDEQAKTVKFSICNISKNTEKIEKSTSGVNFKIVINQKYNFDRPFVIFIKRVKQDKPYFAAKITDGKYLINK